MPFTSLHFTYPIVYLTVGAPRMIGQPLFSILLCFRPFEGLHPTLILSTPLCCLPISFSVCLSFSLLVQCPVGSSLQVLLILFCAHTISVFVSSHYLPFKITGSNLGVYVLMPTRNTKLCRIRLTTRVLPVEASVPTLREPISFKVIKFRIMRAASECPRFKPV